MARAGRIRIGIGGWSFAPWEKTFYPRGLPEDQHLAYASRQFLSVEVNATYYRLQTPETFRRWYHETPEGFVFAIKAPRQVTNRKLLAGAGVSMARFLASGLDRLEEKLGPINWQVAGSRPFDPADFAAFLDLLPPRIGDLPLRHAVEVRHDSFRDPALVRMLQDRGIALVVAGDSAYPQIADGTADFRYVRIMGSNAGGYPPRALDHWAACAQDWARGRAPHGLSYVLPMRDPPEPQDVYLYVISGVKPRNPEAARKLMQRIPQAQWPPDGPDAAPLDKPGPQH